MRRQRTAAFLGNPDVAQVAALGAIAGERPPFQPGLVRRQRNQQFAAAQIGKTVGPDAAAGEIICSEFPYRQAIGEGRGHRIGRVMILVAALECRQPKRIGPALGDCCGDRLGGTVEIVAQPARRSAAKADRLQPEERRRGECLPIPTRGPRRTLRAPPRKRRRRFRHAARQIENEDLRAGDAGALRADAAGDDFVVGVRREYLDAAGSAQHCRRPAACCQTGSKSCSRTSRHVGTRAST